MTKKLNKKGTSLVELIAVIVIMGIIAGIAIPTTIAVIARQKKNAAVKSAQNVYAAAKTVLLEAQSGEAISYVSSAHANISTSTYEVKVADLVSNGELETNPIASEVWIGIDANNKFLTSSNDWTINQQNVHITIASNGEWSFAVTSGSSN